MDALWILKSHLGVLVRLVHSLWLAVEDDLLEFGRVDGRLAGLLGSNLGLVGKLVL